MGDTPHVVGPLVSKGEIDDLVLDCLTGVTASLLARAGQDRRMRAKRRGAWPLYAHAWLDLRRLG
ncbi:hypothetical protein A9Q95_00300 [Rhodobacterales bacterium 59_46_T64]|nr:hypothetical protein A9Q95_00300 [Rhodobacterales bacterium 59_46_T64]